MGHHLDMTICSVFLIKSTVHMSLSSEKPPIHHNEHFQSYICHFHMQKKCFCVKCCPTELSLKININILYLWCPREWSIISHGIEHLKYGKHDRETEFSLHLALVNLNLNCYWLFL